MRIGLVLFVIFSITPFLSASPEDSWTLVWSDEFSSDGEPDPMKWSVIHGQLQWNQDLQRFTRSGNVEVRDGILWITADRDQYGQYTSGAIHSRDKAQWLEGRIEVRAKIPSLRGLHPGIWMLPRFKPYDGMFQNGEIDIMEHVGHEENRIFTAVQTGQNNIHLDNCQGGNLVVQSLEDFHIFAVEWYSDRLDFYTDDRLVFQYKKESDSIDQWPFVQPFYLILSMSVGGNWGGMEGIDDQGFPQSMEVDYVRVYQKEEQRNRFSLNIETSPHGQIEGIPTGSTIPSRRELQLLVTPHEGFQFKAWTGDLYSLDNPLEIRLERDTFLLPLIERPGNVISNPDLLWNHRDWNLFFMGRSRGRFVNDGPGASITIERLGENFWDIMLWQDGLNLKEGQAFRLYLKAYASEEIPIRVNFSQAHAPYKEYTGREILLSHQEQLYQWEGVLPEDDEEGRIILQLGGGTGDIYISEVSLIYLD